MSASPCAAAMLEPAVTGLVGRRHAGWRRAEEVVVALALGAMVALPLVDSLLRLLFHGGISGSTAMVQHLTLIVGMLGGALAARDGRLLSLSTLTTFFGERWRVAARLYSGAFAATVSLVLCLASVELVRTEREGGGILGYDLPTWWALLLLPLGFAVIAARLLARSATGWRGRAGTAALACLMLASLTLVPLEREQLVLPALLALLAATVLGAPLFALLGGAALTLFWGDGVPIAAVPVTQYSLVTSPVLPSLPLFTLAGYFLAEGGASRRLVRVFQEVFARFSGGPAIVTVLACAFFTTFTGASGVTILALGGVLMPLLLAARYDDRTALGLVTGAGGLGMLFPPCLPVILYAVTANAGSPAGGVTLEKMFLGGLGPGVLLLALTIAWGVARRPGVARTPRPFDRRRAAGAIWAAKWELLLPVVALVALFSGWATAIQASAVTALYAFVTTVLIHRDLSLSRDVPRVMAQCGLLVGGVLLILGVALGFTNYLVAAEVAAHAVSWVTATIHSPLLFLLVLNLFLVVVGALMDVYSAIIVVVPLLVPLGTAYGIDPIHLGIIFLANLELGFLVPPVGENLFLSAYRFDKPLAEVTRSVLPMILVLVVGVLLITYVPALTTFLPRMLG